MEEIFACFVGIKLLKTFWLNCLQVHGIDWKQNDDYSTFVLLCECQEHHGSLLFPWSKCLQIPGSSFCKFIDVHCVHHWGIYSLRCVVDELCVSGGAPTLVGTSMFTMWKICTHTKCEVKHNGVPLNPQPMAYNREGGITPRLRLVSIWGVQLLVGFHMQ